MGRVHPRDLVHFLSADKDGLASSRQVCLFPHPPGHSISPPPLPCPCGPNPETKVSCELRTNIWAQFDVLWASLVAQTGEKLPAMQETWVQSLGQEDPLEKGMATHSSTLAWRIPWTEEPGGLQSMALQRVGHN